MTFKETLTAHYVDNFDMLCVQVGKIVGYNDAEDVVQEAYTRALKYSKSYEGDGSSASFGAWLSSIIFNCIKDFHRENRMRGMTSEELEGIEDETSKPINKLVLKRVIDTVDKEPKQKRELLRLFFFKQFTTKEIAELLPFTHSNVRVIIHYFRKKLRAVVGGRIFQ